jgi:hypothetical protein
VLPTLPLGSPADEAAVIAALKAGAASIIAKHSTLLRKAAVAQWEVRLRVTDSTGAWRVVASSPTGETLLHAFFAACSMQEQDGMGWVGSAWVDL